MVPGNGLERESQSWNIWCHLIKVTLDFSKLLQPNKYFLLVPPENAPISVCIDSVGSKKKNKLTTKFSGSYICTKCTQLSFLVLTVLSPYNSVLLSSITWKEALQITQEYWTDFLDASCKLAINSVP